MEIQYQQFNKWVSLAKDIGSLLSNNYDIHMEDLHLYWNGDSINIDNNKLTKLKPITNLCKDFDGNELILEMQDEIELNCANIPNESNLERYFHFIRSKFEQAIEALYSTTDYYSPNSELIHEKVFSIIDSNSKPADTKNKNGEILYDFLRSIRGHVSDLNEFLLVLEGYEKKYDFASHNENTIDLMDRHKLILLYQTGVFEMLLDKYLNPVNPKMKLEDFSKLIATMIGAKSKELRSEVGKLKSEILDPKIKRNVQSEKSMREVNTFLTSLGIPMVNSM